MSLLRSCVHVLGLCLIFATGSSGQAQDSTEPPPPRAAPRAVIAAEELPRAGGIIVIGAETRLGREVAKALVGLGKQVLAAVPAGTDSAELQALKINILTVDPRVPDQLKTTLAAAPLRAVVTTYDIDRDNPRLGLEGTRNVIEAAKAAGVPRFVLVSPTGAGPSVDLLPWYIRFLRGSAMDDAGAAEAHLKASGLEYTIVRTGWIIDDESNPAAVLDEGPSRFSWITNADAAKLTASVVDSKAMSGKTATAYDPERESLLSILF
jgi:uncharacterized protein YbjT (DUF2867 family)